MTGCSFAFGNPFTASSRSATNPRSKACEVLDKTVPVDAVVTIAMTATAIGGLALHADDRTHGRPIAIAGISVGVPFLLGFVSGAIGRSMCSR